MRKRKITIACDRKLTALAKRYKINLSLLMEQAIVFELGYIQEAGRHG